MSDFYCIIFNVEHGSSALINCPNDKKIVLDAGRSSYFSPAEFYRNNLGITNINKLIVSHPHKDHIEDLPNIFNLCKPKIFSRNRSIPDELIYLSNEYYFMEEFQAYYELDKSYIHKISENDTDIPIENWGYVDVTTFYNKPEWLTSPSLNNLSVLTLVRYLGIELVFPGDLEPHGWDLLLNNTNLINNINKSPYKILIASHHGRRSGIRNSNGTIYTRFLDLMKPNLTIMSDKWGNESTDPEAYRYYSQGLFLFNLKTNETEYKNVVTTKTNDFIRIESSSNGLPIVIIG